MCVPLCVNVCVCVRSTGSLCGQCFQDGIGITLIEARGSTIRDAKHKSFELITPYKTFGYVSLHCSLRLLHAEAEVEMASENNS